MKLSRHRKHSCVSGSILILVMVFLLLLAMIASTVMHTGILQFRMAGNYQFREQAFQTVQAVASAIAEDPDNFIIAGEVGDKICSSIAVSPECRSGQLLSVPSVVAAVPAGALMEYLVVRQGPLFLDAVPVRQFQHSVSSTLAYDAAMFEIQVEINGDKNRSGSAGVARGLAVLIAGSGS